MDEAPNPCFSKPVYEDDNNKEDIKNLELIEKKEFQIEYKDIKYDIFISKSANKKYLVFQCYQRNNKYNIFEACLNFDDLIKLNKAFKVCESIDDAYKIILNKFNEKKVYIQDTIDFKIKIIYFTLTNIISGEEQKIEIEIKNSNKNNLIMNEFGEKYSSLIENINKLNKENENMKKDINNLKDEKIKMEEKLNRFEQEMSDIKKENENLKIEIVLLKKYINGQKNINNNINNKINNEIITPSENIKVDPLKFSVKKVLTDSAYCPFALDNTFTVFKSCINNDILLVYCCKNNSLKCDDIINKKNIKTINNAHDNNIMTLKHFNDTINNKDLILSISSLDKMLKIWDTTNWECVLKVIMNNNSNSFISSACLLSSEKDKNIYIIISSDSEYDDLKIFSFYGNQIGKFNNSKKDKSYSLESYFDKKYKKNYIISCNNKNVKSYDFSSQNLYKTYFDGNSNNDHFSAKIWENKNLEEIDLIETDVDGFVNIWNFHSGKLIKKINCCKGIQLRGICIWDENNLFVAADDNSIKLIDIKTEKMKKSFKGHSRTVCTLYKIFIPQLGESLISGAYNEEQIKLWNE